ncbi:MAG TPA: PH domain-containing protein [Demequina sp.]|nr:PH domain-containing protein [Demequina sp.]
MHTYRARSSLIWGWVSVGLGLILAVSDLIASGVTGAKVGLGLGACVAMIGAATYLRPAVEVTPDGIVFRNLVHTATAPFARIQEISMRWSLEMLGDDGIKAGAFSVPASRRGRTGVFSNESVDLAQGDEREGRQDSTGSQVYAAWHTWKDAHGGVPDRTSASITRRLDVVGLALVLGSIAAVVFAFFG